MAVRKHPVRVCSTRKKTKSPVCSAPAMLLAAAMLALPTGAFAQDGFVFGADNQGRPIEHPGFGPAGETSDHDFPAPGAAGQGDYAATLGRLSLVDPTEDVTGLWTVYRITRLVCGALRKGDKGLVEAAPKGFTIVRGDIHALGFGGKNWEKDWYAVTVTGDSEKDAVGGHPAWEIKFGKDGSLKSCGVTVGPKDVREPDAQGDADRQQAIQYMYVGVPQQFSAIITEPYFVGVYTLNTLEATTMAVPCGNEWCRISTLYDFRPGNWFFSSTIRFNLPSKAD